MQFWSIGHSTHTFEAFVSLLRSCRIELLADIRTVPKSRRHPHFHTDALAVALREQDIAYRHLPRLGGWRRASPDSRNGAWRNASFRGYADYAGTAAFAGALEELRELGLRHRTAMMCSEALWWRCHRRIVADQLTVAGDRVWHIDSQGRLAAHALPGFAVVSPDGSVLYPSSLEQE